MKSLRIFVVFFLLFLHTSGTALGYEQEINNKSQRLVIALSNDPPHYNPAIHPGIIVGLLGTQLFSGLVRCDTEGVPHPYLARKWQVSENGLDITFWLHQDAVFHDNVPITPQDVVFSMDVVKKYHPFYSMLAPIRDTTITGEDSFTLHLNYPFPNIFQALTPTLLPILPQHIYGGEPERLLDSDNWEIVGSGPFTFRRYTVEKEIVLQAFSNFFVAERPILQEVIFKIFSDTSDVIMALESNEVDIAPFFPVLSGNLAIQWPEQLIASSTSFDAVHPILSLDFNLRKKPFDNKKVREALALAIDREFIARYLLGPNGATMDGPFPTTYEYYSAPKNKKIKDVQKANTLLDEAGYPRDSQGRRMGITITSLPEVRLLTRPLLEYLSYYLSKDLGIEVFIEETHTPKSWGQKVSKGDFQASLVMPFLWGDPLNGTHRLYNSQNVREGVAWTNISGFNNPDVDEILQKIERGVPEEERRALYERFQNIVRDEQPVIWLGAMPFSTVYNKALRNINLSYWGMLAPMDDVVWDERQGK